MILGELDGRFHYLHTTNLNGHGFCVHGVVRFLFFSFAFLLSFLYFGAVCVK